MSKLLRLTGAKRYTCKNPNPDLKHPLVFQAVDTEGNAATYEVDDDLGEWLLYQKTDRGVSIFREVSDIRPGAIEEVEEPKPAVPGTASGIAASTIQQPAKNSPPPPSEAATAV